MYMSYSRGSSVCDTYETRRERETPQVVRRIYTRVIMMLCENNSFTDCTNECVYEAI